MKRLESLLPGAGRRGRIDGMNLSDVGKKPSKPKCLA